MPKAKKQKNGKWRCQLYLGDETVNGKRKQIVKSFTASTKSEAEDMASEYRRRYGSVQIENIKLSEAISRYIDSKSNILSPATIRGYKTAAENVLSPLADMNIRALTPDVVQRWVNEQALEYSPKTLRNGHGLLTAACSAIDPTFKLNTDFPKKKRNQYYIPSYTEVMRLAGAADPVLERAIMLSAFGSLRRGEICALTHADIDFAGGWVTVSKDVVRDEDGDLHLKEIPKTDDSNRRAPLPQFVIDKLTGELVPLSPEAITHRFHRLVKKLNMPNIRFHDLRHFFASYLHLKGIPDAYIEKYGGWRPGSEVMRAIYRNTINSEEEREARKIVNIFSGLPADDPDPEEEKKKARAT